MGAAASGSRRAGGFSAATVETLRMAGAEGKIHAVNVLEDRELWESVKEFSDWPTIPQVYVGGEFVGGADITRELFETGALQPKGTRLRLSGGKFTVTDGPFIELKELMGGWAVLRANSLEEAIEWCKRFRNIVGDGESEIVQVFGPEDAGPQ